MKTLGPCDVRSFGAQSHTPCNRCVRFVTTVASGYATLATKRTLLLTWAGLPPAGSHQLAAGALIRSPRRRPHSVAAIAVVPGRGAVRYSRATAENSHHGKERPARLPRSTRKSDGRAGNDRDGTEKRFGSFLTHGRAWADRNARRAGGAKPYADRAYRRKRGAARH